MALQARFKPTEWNTESGNSARPGDVPCMYRVLCGYPTCHGYLAYLDYATTYARSSASTACLVLESGYARVAPDTWRLGRHAAHRHDHMPRRARITVNSSTEHAHRRHDGEIVLPDGRLLSRELAYRRDLPARVLFRPNAQYERVAFGTTVTIECNRCHAPSQFIVQPSAAILEEVKRRAHRPD